MTEPVTRYDLVKTIEEDCSVHYEMSASADGYYVFHTDYAAAIAERDAAQRECARLKACNEQAHYGWQNTLDGFEKIAERNAELKADGFYQYQTVVPPIILCGMIGAAICSFLATAPIWAGFLGGIAAGTSVVAYGIQRA